MTGPSLEDEVTFLIGVDDKNTAAETAYAAGDNDFQDVVIGLRVNTDDYFLV